MARSGFRSGDRDRAKALFRALPRSVRKATSAALDSSAEELAEAIRRRVPEDRGDLKASVTVKRGAGKARGREAGADPDLTVRVTEGDRDTFYAPYVEFGTTEQPAQSHFFPTWRANKRRLIGKIRRRQRKAIKEAGL